MLQIEELKFNFQMLKALSVYEEVKPIEESIKAKTSKVISDLKEETDDELVDFFVELLNRLYTTEEKQEPTLEFKRKMDLNNRIIETEKIIETTVLKNARLTNL